MVKLDNRSSGSGDILFDYLPLRPKGARLAGWYGDTAPHWEALDPRALAIHCCNSHQRQTSVCLLSVAYAWQSLYAFSAGITWLQEDFGRWRDFSRGNFTVTLIPTSSYISYTPHSIYNDCRASMAMTGHIHIRLTVIAGVGGACGSEADAQCRTSRPSETGLPTVRHLAVVFKESKLLVTTTTQCTTLTPPPVLSANTAAPLCL